MLLRRGCLLNAWYKLLIWLRYAFIALYKTVSFLYPEEPFSLKAAQVKISKSGSSQCLAGMLHGNPISNELDPVWNWVCVNPLKSLGLNSPSSAHHLEFHGRKISWRCIYYPATLYFRQPIACIAKFARKDTDLLWGELCVSVHGNRSRRLCCCFFIEFWPCRCQSFSCWTPDMEGSVKKYWGICLLCGRWLQCRNQSNNTGNNNCDQVPRVNCHNITKISLQMQFSSSWVINNLLFTGCFLQVDVKSCGCLNGGSCVTNINFPPGRGKYLCVCVPGFEGDLCQVNTDDCASRPCGLLSRCFDGINSFHCECTPGLQGEWVFFSVVA